MTSIIFLLSSDNLIPTRCLLDIKQQKNRAKQNEKTPEGPVMPKVLSADLLISPFYVHNSQPRESSVTSIMNETVDPK